MTVVVIVISAIPTQTDVRRLHTVLIQNINEGFNTSSNATTVL